MFALWPTAQSGQFDPPLRWAAFAGQGGQFFFVFVLIGAAAVLAAVGYTAGIRPYGYAGLGDLAVLIFFGWVAVMGTFFLHTMRLDWDILLPATSWYASPASWLVRPYRAG